MFNRPEKLLHKVLNSLLWKVVIWRGLKCVTWTISAKTVGSLVPVGTSRMPGVSSWSAQGKKEISARKWAKQWLITSGGNAGARRVTKVARGGKKRAWFACLLARFLFLEPPQLLWSVYGCPPYQLGDHIGQESLGASKWAFYRSFLKKDFFQIKSRAK